MVAFKRNAFRVATVVLLFLRAALPASAARTDFVVLVNGDQITGDVKTLSRGQLQLKTDDVGTIYVEWGKIASISTAGQFDVSTRDGRRLVGRLDAGPGGQVALVDGDGTVLALPILDVVDIAPLGARFFSRIDGSVDLGASYTKSSGVGQASVSAAATYRRPSFETSTKLSTMLTRKPDVPETTQFSLNVGYAKYHANRWQTMPFGLFEHNSELGLDLRATAALLIGRHLLQSNRSTLTLAGGLSTGRELPVGEPARTNVDAVIALSSALFTYDYPKTSVDFSLLVFPAIKDAGRIRVNANGKLKRELFRDIFFAVTAYDAFDSRPPTADAQKNDVGFTVSLGWSF